MLLLFTIDDCYPDPADPKAWALEQIFIFAFHTIQITVFHIVVILYARELQMQFVELWPRPTESKFLEIAQSISMTAHCSRFFLQ